MQDTFLLLTQLGHGDAEARRMLDETLATKQRFKDVDALLHAVYEHSNRPPAARIGGHGGDSAAATVHAAR